MLVVEAGFKWSELAMAGSSQSLFATRKLLEVRIPTGKPGTEGSAALQRYLRDVCPPDTVTLVQLPALDWRSAEVGWFEALGRGRDRWSRRASITRKALPQWLAGRLQSAASRTPTRRRSSFIADRVEGNLMAALPGSAEARALVSSRARSSFDQVREAVLDVARYDVFDLGEVDARGRRRCASRACSTACRAKVSRRRSCCGRSPRKSARIGRMRTGLARRQAVCGADARSTHPRVRTRSRCEAHCHALHAHASEAAHCAMPRASTA